MPFDYFEIVGLDSKDRIAADVVDDTEIGRACFADCHALPRFTPARLGKVRLNTMTVKGVMED